MDGESIDRFPCIRKKRWSWVAVENVRVRAEGVKRPARNCTARRRDGSRNSVVKTHCFHRWYPGICPGRRVQELDYRQRGVGTGFSGRLPRVSGIVLGFSSPPFSSPSRPPSPLRAILPSGQLVLNRGVVRLTRSTFCDVLSWEKRKRIFSLVLSFVVVDR